jgi:predicted acyltransferase
MSVSQPRILDTTLKPGRVLSIDVLRGLTIALMILVNDAGDWGHVFPQLDHAEWNGWTLTDLVFPTFLFLMGVSLLFSLEAREARGNCKKTLTGHLFSRSGKIILLDLALAYFPRMHWHGLRLFGVLTRIGLCSLFAGLILLLTRKAKVLTGIVVLLLVGYWLLMRHVPVPGAGVPGTDIPFLDQDMNLAAWIDRGFTDWTLHWIHAGRLYDKTRDPEGLLSTLPAVATTLLGALCGMWMKHARAAGISASRMRLTLALAGAVSFIAGDIWSVWFPINKNLWTSSYVLLCAGIAAIAVAACSWLVDERPQPWPAWLRFATWPWLVFGSNAIVAFTSSVVFVKTMQYIRLTDADGNRHNLWYLAYARLFARHGSTNWTSLFFAISFVVLCFLPNVILWRKKIFVKL